MEETPSRSELDNMIESIYMNSNSDDSSSSFNQNITGIQLIVEIYY